MVLENSFNALGRTDKMIKVDSPDDKTREEILKVYTENRVPLAEDVSLKEIARTTETFSGADLEALVREAVLIALEEYKFEVENKTVSINHFIKAREKIKSSLTEKIKKVYDDFEEHGAEFVPNYVG